ncbi:hypothetical protein D3C78_1048730 [compost metagenome]
MAENQLLIQRLNDIIDGEGTYLLLHLAVQHNLENHIAKLLLHAVRIIIIDCFERFVQLFNKVFANGLVSLLTIPRAALRTAQYGDDLMQALEGAVAKRRIIRARNPYQ